VVDAQLIQYIYDQRKKGYTEPQIRSALNQAGYSNSQIDAVLSPHSKIRMIAVLFVVFAIITVTIIMLLRTQPDTDRLYESPPLAVSPKSPASPQKVTTQTSNQPFEVIDLPQDESINMENGINDIVEAAKNNPDVAKSLCIELQQPFVDQCLLESGLAHNNGYFCPFIDDRNRRDSCYFNIVFATKQTELCEPIVNLYLHDTCAKL